MSTKTALITGASSGIGLEFARVLAAQKVNLILVARSTSKLEELAQSLHNQFDVEVNILTQDLSEYKNALSVFEWCSSHKLQVDYLINNAGFGELGNFHETDWNRQEQMLNLNMTTLAYLTHLFLPDMIKRKNGKILNIASTAAFQPGPGMAVYFATKAFVLHFSEAIGAELAGTGVTVTALCPGATESNFAKEAKATESKLFKGRKLPSSAEVAKYGIKAMMKGKAVAIHGSLNYFMVNSIRFVPRSIVTMISSAIMGK